MQNYKILIASSKKTGVLAEKLGDQLGANHSVTDFNEIKSTSSKMTLDTLKGVTEKYDFAVMIFDETDANSSVEGDALKERDNRFFEAGIFVAAFGRDRCFFVTSLERPYLPPDLDGIRTLQFKEPEFSKLNDREVCGKAISHVGSQILDLMEQVTKPKNNRLSKETLLDRERMSPNGELGEDHVVVTVTQPFKINYEMACQVRKNLDAGIDYVYCFHGDLVGIPKICQFLQILLLAPMLGCAEEFEYSSRMKKFQELSTRHIMLQYLESICQRQNLKIYLLKDAPKIQYVIHNATSRNDAIFYLNYRDEFIEWETGESAYSIWLEMRKTLGISPDESSALFREGRDFNLKDHVFSGALKNEMRKQFPGIHEEVLKICCEGP